ncbi:MAG TPA: tetratricopeptide repeat protein, partial [Phycisphaerales bacterium]|nr:tetratricopeptide repeat protein [Phycisphaerales bacterium]
GALVTGAWLMEKYLACWRNSGELFEHALFVTEGNWMALGQYGLWIEDKGDAAKADKQLSEAQKLWKEALGYYDQSVAAAPLYASMYHNRGNILFKIRDLKGAEEAYRMAVQLTPQSWESQFQLGQLLAVERRIKEGLPFLEAAAKLKPDLFEAHAVLADVYVQLNNFAGAHDEAVKALTITPGDARMQSIKAQCEAAMQFQPGMQGR